MTMAPEESPPGAAVSSARRPFRKLMPSPSGRRRSRMRTSGAPRPNSARAFLRVSAVRTSNPSAVRASSARTRNTASSSTTRMLALMDPPRRGPLSYLQRQGEQERRAGAGLLQDQVPAMGARDVARQGETDADAARLARDERLEQPRPS